MKELLLKIAGVKTEKAFYDKYPSKEAFFKAHPEAQAIIAQYQKEQEEGVEENSKEQMTGGPEESAEEMAMGGLIKRKDGSYSKRGLWDNIRANKGSGKKPTKKMLEQAKKIQAEEMMYGGMVDSYLNGGGIDNPGFKALPKSVQENIIANMEMGGYVEEMADGGIPQRYKNMGFTRVGQKKQGDGKHKWKVLAKKGDQYKVVQGGWRGMQDFKQHKSEKRRDRFWDRMGGRDSAKAKDPFSPLYWHKRFGTWANGGIIPEMEDLILAGENMYNMGGMVEYPTYYPGGGMIAGPIMGYEDAMFEYAMGGGININPANKGKFTAWAKKRGMSVQEAANKVMANKEKYTADVVRMANFAKNAATWKKQDGGELDVFSAFTNKVPVQTESYQGQPEQVVLPNGMIESVDAKTAHENMADDEITDVLPQGSHIQSSRNKLTPDQYATLMEMFKPETAEKDIKMLEQVYKAKYGKKKNKELSPSDITEYAKKAYQKTPTPNNFDTEKLISGNKQSFVDLGMTMNDLIKSGKEMATQGMAYGGRVNKYALGTESDMGVMYNRPELDEFGNPIDYNTTILDEGTSKWTNPIAGIYDKLIKEGILTYNPKLGNEVKNGIKVGKLQVNNDKLKNLSYEEYLPIAQAIEQMDLANVRQSKTPGYKTYFGGNNPLFNARYFVETKKGKAYDKNVSKETVFRDYFEELGIVPTPELIKNAEKILDSPQGEEIYNYYIKQTPGMRPNPQNIPTLGDTPNKKGIQQLKAMPPITQPVSVPTPVVTPQGETVRYGDMGNYAVTETTPQQMPRRSKYYSGLLESQLGRGLAANEAELQAYLTNTPLYQMETPDTYIRSRKTEVPVGNILYNIEKAQRNAANALASQTGDWSTLAGNIANQGAIAMNQVGDTLSNLNLQNINLYNQQQDLEQKLLESNMGVRNWNLYNKQKLTNEKRNLFGQKAVKDAEMYSNYVKKMSENQQKEQQDKLALLSTMGAYPETFKGGVGQEVANRILGTYGGYNNPFAGTALDYFLNR